MPRRFFRISTRLLIQRRQPAVRCKQAGQHRQRGLKCQRRPLPMSKPRKRNSKIEMPHGQEMLQAHCLQCLFGSFFIAPLPKVNHRETKMSRWTVAINVERTLESALGVITSSLPQIHLADAQMQVWQSWIETLGLQQARQCSIHVAFLELDDSHQEISPGTWRWWSIWFCGSGGSLHLFLRGDCFLSLFLSRLRLRRIVDQLLQNCFCLSSPTQHQVTLRKLLREASLIRPFLPQILEEWQRLVRTPRIQIHSSQVVMLLSYRDLNRLGLIFAWLLDVAESHKLLQHGLSCSWIHAQIRGMHSEISPLILPTLDTSDLRSLVESLHQHSAVHVFAHRQAEQCEHSRRHIQQGGAVDALILLDVLALHTNDPEWTMLNRRPRRLVRNSGRSQVIRVKPVIRYQDHGHVRSSQLQQGLQHHVVETVGSVHDIFVDLKFVIGNALHLRWMEVHKPVTEMVDPVVVDGKEIPS